MNHRCLPLLALLATPLSSQLNTTSVWDDAPIVHLVDLDDGKSNAIVGSVSPDELTMFFASDRTGGTGGWDLWHSTRSSLRGKWQAPIQVPGANTTADECSPTVYFAPDGSLEMFFIRKQAASWDVWTAKRTTSGTWSAPTKMGAEVNATGIFNAYLDVTYDGTLVSVTRKVAQAYYAYDLKRVMVSSAFQAAILIPAVQLRSSDTIELSHDGKLGLFHALDSKQTRRWVLARKQPSGWKPIAPLSRLKNVIDAEIGRLTGRLYESHAKSGRASIYMRTAIASPITRTRPHVDGMRLSFNSSGALDAFIPIHSAKLGQPLGLNVADDFLNQTLCTWALSPTIYQHGVRLPGIDNNLHLATAVILAGSSAGSNGAHHLALTIPNNQNLIGLAVYMQAMLSGGAKPEFTGLLRLQVTN